LVFEHRIAVTPAWAQTAPEASEMQNFAFPYTAAESLTLSADGRVSLRKLEDRQLKEVRELEDRFEAEMKALYSKHYQERLELKKKYQR
jgi:hypothetical protein